MGHPNRHIIGPELIESLGSRYPIGILAALFKNCATGWRVIWADSKCADNDGITIQKTAEPRPGVVKQHIAKERKKRSQRAKNRAEVFTPAAL